ncbi:hypothetical protein [Pyrococcus kukulkanii]|uniref:hypothetical protein n=1 Tax=Pyrococcus kukulkanii TaxID=1609559 RepID=UPI0035614514
MKWRDLSRKEAERILKDLKRKSELLKLEDWEKHYGIMARRIEEKVGLALSII